MAAAPAHLGDAPPAALAALLVPGGGAAGATAGLADAVGDLAAGGDLVACVRAGTDCFAEWLLRSASGTPAATVCAALRLDAGGRIERMLTLGSPPLPPVTGPPDGAGASVPGDAGRGTVERYLARLAANDFVGAVACFTDDCVYSHPPYSPATGRVQFGSAAELLEGLTTLRGPRQVSAVVDRYVQRGAIGFLEGSVAAVPDATFLASFAFAADGRIRRYATWFGRPGTVA